MVTIIANKMKALWSMRTTIKVISLKLQKKLLSIKWSYIVFLKQSVLEAGSCFYMMSVPLCFDAFLFKKNFSPDLIALINGCESEWFCGLLNFWNYSSPLATTARNYASEINSFAFAWAIRAILCFSIASCHEAS